MRQEQRLLDPLTAEDGFTLIELMVAVLASIVVVIALFNLQDVTLRQTSRAFSKVDATQHAREAMENIENELHSGCLADNITPILGGSTSTTLLFASQYGTGPTLVPVEHKIVFDSTAQTLTETTYAETGESQDSDGLPVYTFSTTPLSGPRTLLSDVAQSATTPVFQYFSYQEPLQSGGQPYTDGAGNPYMMLLDGTSAIPGTSTVPAASPLSSSPSLSNSNAQNTAEVVITLAIGPAGGSPINTGLSDAVDTFQDGVVLRLTPAPNHAGDGNVFLPCQ